VVLVEPDGERSFITSPGVEASLGARALADVPLQAGDAVFVSGYDLCYPGLGPAIAAWVGTMPAGVSLVVDPGPLVAEIPAAILDVVLQTAAIWTMNRREADLLGEGVARLACSALLVIRDGAAGATISGAGVFVTVTIPAPPVAMVDSTGAGDAHTGVLIAALADGLSPIPAVARANAAAAHSVTQKGPATAPARAALDRSLA
jgi:sugar/nucleoside kinase (ribokinase family)